MEKLFPLLLMLIQISKTVSRETITQQKPGKYEITNKIVPVFKGICLQLFGQQSMSSRSLQASKINFF